MTDIDIKSSLEVWGCTEIDIMGDEVWFVNDEGLEGKLEKSEFTLESDCLTNATYYSCCGEVLDMDIRVCFKCLEHC
jgi:hypothetical protein